MAEAEADDSSGGRDGGDGSRKEGFSAMGMAAAAG